MGRLQSVSTGSREVGDRQPNDGVGKGREHADSDRKAGRSCEFCGRKCAGELVRGDGVSLQASAAAVATSGRMAGDAGRPADVQRSQTRPRAADADPVFETLRGLGYAGAYDAVRRTALTRYVDNGIIAIDNKPLSAQSGLWHWAASGRQPSIASTEPPS
jgi:hypothetical protein